MRPRHPGTTAKQEKLVDRHTFLQAFAAPGAAIVAPIDLVTADANAGAGDIPIRRVAAAWGGLHD